MRARTCHQAASGKPMAHKFDKPHSHSTLLFPTLLNCEGECILFLCHMLQLPLDRVSHILEIALVSLCRLYFRVAEEQCVSMINAPSYAPCTTHSINNP